MTAFAVAAVTGRALHGAAAGSQDGGAETGVSRAAAVGPAR